MSTLCMPFEESSLYEIIELNNGDIALAKEGDSKKPIVSIRFSDEATDYLDDERLAVAKSMIEAGLQAVFGIEAEAVEAVDVSELETLH